MQDYIIYPKQFQHEKIPIQKNKCFMIMPFDIDFDPIYGAIKDEVESHEIMCNRVDEMNGSQPIVNKIIRGILEAQYIIVDITNAKPNVFYELGIAHSFREAQNILIIKQQGTTYPFDITHLPYHEYSSNNIYQLKSIIRDFINSSKYITDFREALVINDIYDYSVSNSTNFIEYIEEYFNGDLKFYSDILNQNTTCENSTEIENAFNHFEKLFVKTLQEHNALLIDGITRVYIKLIERCNIDSLSLKFAERFDNCFFQCGIDDDALRVSKETDLMLALADNNKLLNFCLPWIIEYFSKSKSSSIDLNRYKLEYFLMNTTNKEIETTIINSIFNEDCHVREHMADIIGAKHLTAGFSALKNQLLIEENWFTIGSIVEAIGRIAPQDEGIQVIESWIQLNKKKMLEEKQFFLLKHLLHGLAFLDDDNNIHVQNFIDQFGHFLHENEVGPID